MMPLSLVKCCSPLSRSTLSDAQAGELEQVFKALADRHRVKILNRLIAAGEDAVCVCEFTDTLGLKQPTVSYHLKQLADAGLVSRERRGTFAYYRLVPDALEGLGALLAAPPAAAAPHAARTSLSASSAGSPARRASRATASAS